MAKGQKSGQKSGKRPGDIRDAGDQDEELWRRVTAEVRPLRTRGKTAPALAPASGPSERPEQADRRATTPPSTTPRSTSPAPARRPALPTARIGIPSEPELAHGVAAGLDKRTLARLRRGQIPIEAEIDLHGSTQDEAHRTLEAFLARSQAAGRRCLLVITGKGLRADGAGGVLRNAVPRWMNEAPNRERVLAFSHAIPADGGEGALYVLLRRVRRQPGRPLV